jgi:hypothetical protein
LSDDEINPNRTGQISRESRHREEMGLFSALLAA